MQKDQQEAPQAQLQDVVKESNPLSRRDFLRLGGVAGLGLVGTGLLWKETLSSGVRSLAQGLGFFGQGLREDGKFKLSPLSPIQTRGQRGRLKSPRLFSQRRRLMGTWCSISIYSSDPQEAQRVTALAFSEMEAVDRLMSLHSRHSQISQLNGMPPGSHHPRFDPRLVEVVRIAQKYSERTGGVYDITILPLMKLFGFYPFLFQPSLEQVPTDREIARALERVSYRNLHINPSQGTIELGEENMGIDLGSIGKGYALDQAARVLKDQGVRSALLDAGGNLLAIGAPYEDPDPRMGWTIGIRSSIKDHEDHGSPQGDIVDTLILRDQAVATSGVDQNFVRFGGGGDPSHPNSRGLGTPKKSFPSKSLDFYSQSKIDPKIKLHSEEIGHIFNALTGHPVKDYRSCTVVTPHGVDSDVLSTSGYILGREKSRTLFPEAQFHFFT